MKNNKFLKLLKEDPSILYIYQFGSSVYDVQLSDSDIDFLVVTSNDFQIPQEYISYAYEIEKVRDDSIIHNLKYESCDFIFYTVDK